MKLVDMKISQLIKLMESGEVSSEEITKACISNIENENLDSTNYQILLKDEAIDKAREIDNRRKNKEVLGSLAGIPFAITDDISTKGIGTTAGSKILENYIPPFNATVIDQLNEDNGVILGKVKVNEFGLKPTDHISKALDSKGGIFGLSTSMDSSKVSMKPTYGLISRYGVIGATSSFDQIVPITKSVEDLAVVLNSVVGYDKKDSTSINMEKKDYTKALINDIKGIKIGVPTELKDHNQFNIIIKELEKLGADIQTVSLSNLKYILPVYQILSSAEFASNSARYDGISLGYRTKDYSDREQLYKKTRAEGFSKEAKKRILFGNYVISSGQYEKYYKKAQKIRAMIKEEFTKVTQEYGVIMLPFTSCKDNSYNLAANVTGLPGVTIPCGIQFIGSAFKEEELIKLAYTYENAIAYEGRMVISND